MKVDKFSGSLPVPPFRRLSASECLTREECGDLLGLSRERIRQIEMEALDKCRVALEAHGYTLADLIGDDVRGSDGVTGKRIHRSD